MVSARLVAQRAGAVLATALSLFGCSDPAPRCGTLAGCDIRSPSCQKRALSYAVCLRGREESTDLEIAVVTQPRDAFLDQEEADAESYETDTGRLVRRGLTLFGLRSSDSDVGADARRQARRVGARYESDPPRILIIDDGRRLRGSYVSVLVHELVHALQDAAGEIDPSTLPARFDSQLAHRALVEGEATILGDETYLQGWDLSFDESRYTRSLRSYRALSSRFYYADREDLLGALYGRFTYAFGASYLWELRQQDGLAAVATAFENPPVSSFAVMALDPARPDQRDDDLGEDAVPVLPDLSLIASRHLGRFAYSAFSQVFTPGGFLIGSLPDEEFVADTLSVFSSADDVVLSAWRIRFDDAERVARFLGRLPDGLDDLVRFRSDGADLLMFASEDVALLDALPEELAFEAAGDDYVSESEGAASHRLDCMEHPGPEN